MDPSNKTNPGLEVPLKGQEQRPPVPGGSTEMLPQAPEKPSPQESASLQSSAAALALPATPLTQAQPPVAPVTDNAVATTTTDNLTADDEGDLIEKTWVEKAKKIVESTRDDPYRQSEELTLFKADYMKKRYGKTIKINQ